MRLIEQTYPDACEVGALSIDPDSRTFAHVYHLIPGSSRLVDTSVDFGRRRTAAEDYIDLAHIAITLASERRGKAITKRDIAGLALMDICYRHHHDDGRSIFVPASDGSRIELIESVVAGHLGWGNARVSASTNPRLAVDEETGYGLGKVRLVEPGGVHKRRVVFLPTNGRRTEENVEQFLALKHLRAMNVFAAIQHRPTGIDERIVLAENLIPTTRGG